MMLKKGQSRRVAQAANWPYGAELVANGSFEQIVSGFPTNWTPMNTGTSSYMTVDTSLKSHGMQGLKITDDGVGGSREVGVKSDPIPILNGVTYTAEVKTNVSQGTVHLLVRTYDSSGNPSTQLRGKQSSSQKPERSFMNMVLPFSCICSKRAMPLLT